MTRTQRVAFTQRQIGPIGSVVRLVVGLFLLIFGFRAEPTALELAIGFLLLPIVEVMVVLALRSPGSPALHLYGARGYAINFGIAGALWVIAPIPAMLFYGSSILLAFIRGDAGCEILTISNLIRRRDDQLACAVFSPIDALENAH